MIINTTTISETYNTCRVHGRRPCRNAISVPGFMHKAHAFDCERIRNAKRFVICALKKLPRNLCRSNTDKGAPWITARTHGTDNTGYALEIAEKLIAMGIALGYVTIMPSTVGQTDVPNIIIEDIRYRNEQAMNRRKPNNTPV